MKALRVVCILAVLGMLALSVPAAADEGPGVAEAPQGDPIHFLPIVGDIATGIEVMNLSDTQQTMVDIWYYDSLGAVVARNQNMRINGLSSRTIYPLPAAVTSASSAVVVSFSAKTNPTHPTDVLGGPLSPGTGYTLNGDCPIATTINRFVGGAAPASSYTGVGQPLLPLDEADGDPYVGQDTYWIYGPIIQKNNNGWNSTIYIQHAYLGELEGETVAPLPDADVDIYFYEVDGSGPIAQANVYLPAFASKSFDITSFGLLADGEPYSLWIRSNGPIAGVVDQYDADSAANAGILLTYRASPKNRYDAASSAANFNFGPLVFSQYNGWESGIGVLNTDENEDADVVVTFHAKDGTPLQTLHRRLEERSDFIVYPLSSFGLPVDQIGSVSIENQAYTPPGGDPSTAFAPLVSVVNQFIPGEKGSAYNTFMAQFDVLDGDWAALDVATMLVAPLMMKYNGGSTLNSGWSTGIAIMNTDMDDPDAERILLEFYDAAGGPVPVDTVSFNLRGGATHIIDLRYYFGGATYIPSGWVGSCRAQSVPDNGDAEPIAAVVNEIYDAPAGAAQVAGDLFMTYEGYPLYPTPTPEPTPTPGKPGKCLDLDGIKLLCAGAAPVEDGVVAIRSSNGQVVRWTTTYPNGYFEFKDTDTCEFIEGIYFVSNQVVTDTDTFTWQDLTWFNAFTGTWITPIELVDTDADGDIDADDLFYKTNMNQLNFVGVNCVTDECRIATYTATVYLDGDGDTVVDPGEEAEGATVVETGTGDWSNITIEGTTNALGIATLNIPAGTWDEVITSAPFDCTQSWAVPCAGTPAYTVDMADCSAP